jgi:predicted metallo-beta-lactamase superfamily hydrolase
MAPVIDGGKEHDVAVMTCAEFLGKAVDPLEANRDALYGVLEANRDAPER